MDFLQNSIQESQEVLEAKFAEEKRDLERGWTDRQRGAIESAMAEAKQVADRQCQDMRVQFAREYEELQNR